MTPESLFIADLPGIALLFLIGIAILIVATFVRHRLISNRRMRSAQKETSKQTVVKYHVKYQLEAADAYQREAQEMAVQGYRPVGQCWLPGSYDWGVFLVAAFLSLFGVGVIMLIYMLVTRPRGVLIVTYELRERKDCAAA